jgi:uncharacterized protein (TIGR03790 family)
VPYRFIARGACIGVLLCFTFALRGQTPDQVLVVVNKRSAISREIGSYYIQKRGVPLVNLVTLSTKAEEDADRAQFNREIEGPIGDFLKSRGLTEKILYIVLTSGVPLRIKGKGEGLRSETASVDSELTLLYARLRGTSVPLAGPAPNPFFRQRDAPFRHPWFPLYLVTRLDGYDMRDMKALVDRALRAPGAASRPGRFVIDLKAREYDEGNQWLRNAALLLPKDRLVLDETAKVIENIGGVIAYAGWGSNDTDRKHRFLRFEWLPGAIATEFVSTDGRTFRRPPDAWEIRGSWDDPKQFFAGSPQSLTADYIHEGASGASGQVDEPFLQFCPRPEFVLPAYASGRNLAESFYMGIPGLSWMNVVVGDPLMRLK